MTLTYMFIEDGRLRQSSAPPHASLRIDQASGRLLPSAISDLHRSFKAWGDAGLSPGPIVADRTWVSPGGALAFSFAEGNKPRPLAANVAQAPDLAAWLVLLDKWMETFVVVARARTFWSPDELGDALSFTTPAFLPTALVAQQPDNWQRVARALAAALADGQPKHAG